MILTILVASISLIGLMVIHEFGHFILAKKFGIRVEEFGLGYPPRLLGKKIGETIYSLNLLPFGGFVKLFGENGPPSSKTSTGKEAFYSRNKLERAIILIAGVFMNFVLGVVVISIIFTNGVLI